MSHHLFLADPPEIVPLSTNAPLERVIAQVKFPPIHLAEKKGIHVAFHEGIQRDFPYFAEERLLQIAWAPEGGEPKQVDTQNISYRFTSADKHWELVLANDFISLVCTRYDTREEFLKRFRLAMDAAIDCLGIPFWGRLGLRYINRGPRSEDHARDQYRMMMKPEYRGVPGTPLFDGLTNCLFSAEWDLGGLFAAVRHGYLATGTTYEPSGVPPWNRDGWILDVDVFFHPERVGEGGLFAADTLCTKFNELADREYCIFRELVTPEFINEHRGEKQ